MSVSFKPDKFNIVVLSRWQSNSGRWIIFFGTHYNGKELCYDVGQFRTTDGVCQRIHCKNDKPGAMIQYDEIKKALSKIKEGGERDEKPQYRIFGPNGGPVN